MRSLFWVQGPGLTSVRTPSFPTPRSGLDRERHTHHVLSLSLSLSISLLFLFRRRRQHLASLPWNLRWCSRRRPHRPPASTRSHGCIASRRHAGDLMSLCCSTALHAPMQDAKICPSSVIWWVSVGVRFALKISDTFSFVHANCLLHDASTHATRPVATSSSI
jgi:hypothetical protein